MLSVMLIIALICWTGLLYRAGTSEVASKSGKLQVFLAAIYLGVLAPLVGAFLHKQVAPGIEGGLVEIPMDGAEYSGGPGASNRLGAMNPNNCALPSGQCQAAVFTGGGLVVRDAGSFGGNLSIAGDTKTAGMTVNGDYANGIGLEIGGFWNAGVAGVPINFDNPYDGGYGVAIQTAQLTDGGMEISYYDIWGNPTPLDINMGTVISRAGFSSLKGSVGTLSNSQFECNQPAIGLVALADAGNLMNEDCTGILTLSQPGVTGSAAGKFLSIRPIQLPDGGIESNFLGYGPLANYWPTEFAQPVIVNGKLTATQGVNSLTCATGHVDGPTAACPSVGQVPTATGASSFTWQTPAAGGATQWTDAGAYSDSQWPTGNRTDIAYLGGKVFIGPNADFSPYPPANAPTPALTLWVVPNNSQTMSLRALPGYNDSGPMGIDFKLNDQTIGFAGDSPSAQIQVNRTNFSSGQSQIKFLTKKGGGTTEDFRIGDQNGVNRSFRPLQMEGLKITQLANGTAVDDAAAFGQLPQAETNISGYNGNSAATLPLILANYKAQAAATPREVSVTINGTGGSTAGTITVALFDETSATTLCTVTVTACAVATNVIGNIANSTACTGSISANDVLDLRLTANTCTNNPTFNATAGWK